MAYQASFFPEINTLGDVLADEGYKQYFFIGSIDSSAAGKSTLKSTATTK